MEVHLKAIHPWAGIPKRATGKSFGYDLQTIEDVTIGPRETKVVKTGLVLAQDLLFDEEVGGVALLVLPRSSLPLKRGLIVANSPGLVDADYTGEIGVIVHNLKDEPVTLALGERIAQAVFVTLWTPRIVEADKVEERAERGGFGSTGT